MGGFVKRVLILKEASKSFSLGGRLSAIVKAESNFYNLTLKLSTIDFVLDDYIFFATDGINCERAKIEKTNLSSTEFKMKLDISNGLCCAIFHQSNALVAFGAVGCPKLCENDIINFYNKKINETEVYDDERIAEFDYYYNLKQSDNDDAELKNVRTIDSEADFSKEDKGGFNFNKYADAETKNKTEKSKASFFEAACGDDKASEPCEKSENAPYYITAKNELEAIFSRGKPELALEKVVPKSRWVRVCYSQDKYYVVGIVNEQNQPKYICYGVPATFGNPPEKLKDYSSFIPSSLFSPASDGYYIMFQSALSGDLITPSISIFGF